MNIPVKYVELGLQSDGRNIGVIMTVMQPSSVMALDAWADVDAAIDAARQSRKQSIERLTTASSLVILSGAVWLMWPNLQSALKGDEGLLEGLGYPLLIIAYGLILQDSVLDDAKARTRIGSFACIAWPVLLILAAKHLNFEDYAALIGSGLLVVVAYACFQTSANVLQGGLDVLRWRAIMTGLGGVAAFSLFVGNIPESMTYEWLASLTALGSAVVVTGYIWFVGDEQRGQRKIFTKRLDGIESQLLQLKADGAAVDQASSLIMTAKEEGHIDPEYGMKLLDEAEEDIERTLSLSGDVEIIQADALEAIQKAESIAPTVKRPRKSFDMGAREVKLGSLREGEMLFRQSKKLANDIIEWWGVAEQSIAEAGRLLTGNDAESVQHLKELLADAKKKMANEAPREAYEFASVIPQQLLADEDAQGRALESLKEATRQLKQTDGLDTEEMELRLERAEQAIEAGSPSQAIGLADGVVRSIEAERTAMDNVRRGLKQRKKLVAQYKDRDDKDEWEKRLKSVEDAADTKQWSRANTLLDAITTDLDNEGQATEEALELYDFVVEEWHTLRNQCDASNISIENENRRACEQAIAMAGEALAVGRVEDCLNQLSQADTAMERLRRLI
ncbi:MerC domain-containing protein [Euryarchaeota archaeon]|nr:MerC domain-containing protein [Euryarchaeota archaeon]MDA8689843.1 MerC domain-containing protein [Euryarchaeota archaeon]